MAKILFIPFSVAGGLLAGFVAKKLFDVAWGVVSDEEVPEPEHRRIQVGKLLLAAGIEGAIFRATRAAADHGSRHAFATLTGTWPGEEEPEPE
jgi:homospermidine synthase